MSKNARKQLQFKFLRKGSLEVNTLIVWIILLVFLVLVGIIIIAVRGEGNNAIGGLCERTKGLFGC